MRARRPRRRLRPHRLRRADRQRPLRAAGPHPRLPPARRHPRHPRRRPRHPAGKSALYAGARLLMDEFGTDTVDRIVLAGAFGAHISPKHAMILGMIPDCDLARVTSAGNAAGTGARIALLNVAARREVEALVTRIHKVETAIEPRFQEHFVAASAIPHATAPFPHLAAAARRRLQRRWREAAAPPGLSPAGLRNHRYVTAPERSKRALPARCGPTKPKHCFGRAVRRSAGARRRRGVRPGPSAAIRRAEDRCPKRRSRWRGRRGRRKSGQAAAVRNDRSTPFRNGDGHSEPLVIPATALPDSFGVSALTAADCLRKRCGLPDLAVDKSGRGRPPRGGRETRPPGRPRPDWQRQSRRHPPFASARARSGERPGRGSASAFPGRDSRAISPLRSSRRAKGHSAGRIPVRGAWRRRGSGPCAPAGRSPPPARRPRQGRRSRPGCGRPTGRWSSSR